LTGKDEGSIGQQAWLHIWCGIYSTPEPPTKFDRRKAAEAGLVLIAPTIIGSQMRCAFSYENHTIFDIEHGAYFTSR
jgi:hypothetical protein